MQTVSPDDLLTAAGLAARLVVKPETILRWHREGKIPSRKLSHKILRFNLVDVVAALEASQRPEGQGVAR